MADLMGMMRRPLFMLFMFRGRNGKKGFRLGACVCVSLYQIRGEDERALWSEKKGVVWRASCVGCGVVNPNSANTLARNEFCIWTRFCVHASEKLVEAGAAPPRCVYMQ